MHCKLKGIRSQDGIFPPDDCIETGLYAKQGQANTNNTIQYNTDNAKEMQVGITIRAKFMRWSEYLESRA